MDEFLVLVTIHAVLCFAGAALKEYLARPPPKSGRWMRG